MYTAVIMATTKPTHAVANCSVAVMCGRNEIKSDNALVAVPNSPRDIG